MNPIYYPVMKIKQGTSECMQTSAAQLISFFDSNITVDEILQNVPVYVENGEKIGTAPEHLGAYLLSKGYKVTFYIFDVELFDPTWASLSPQEVLEALRARQAYIPENSWLAKYHHILIDGWKQYVEAG